MIIDMFTHVYPQTIYDRVQKILPNFGDLQKYIVTNPLLFDMDTRFRLMDKFDDYRQAITLVSPPLESVANAEQGAEIARFTNDALADLVAKHPDRFAAFGASLSLLDMDQAMTELHRAIGDLKAGGIQIFTDVGGRCIDHPDFHPLFAAMAEYGKPIWMHPGRSKNANDFIDEEQSLFDMWQIVGWPYITSVAMMRLVLTGLFDRHPEIKIITHHLGGVIPQHPQRIANSLIRQIRQLEHQNPGQEFDFLRRPPIDQLKMFYGDTALNGAVSPLRNGIEFFGVNNVVFGTDAPYATIQLELDMMDQLGLDPDAKQRILSGNAERILGL